MELLSGVDGVGEGAAAGAGAGEEPNSDQRKLMMAAMERSSLGVGCDRQMCIQNMLKADDLGGGNERNRSDAETDCSLFFVLLLWKYLLRADKVHEVGMEI